MDRTNFKKLSDIERISFFLDEYKKGLIHNEVIKQYGLARNTVADTFKRNNYTYDKELLIYISNNKDISKESIKYYKSSTKVLPDKNEQNTKVTQKYYNNSIAKEEVVNVIGWVKDQQEKQEEYEKLFNYVREQIKKDNIIELPKLEIEKDALKGKAIGKSMKVYTDVLNDFDAFCNKSEFKKQDILSQALLEFLKKYNNKV